VLIVDDEPDVIAFLSSLLEDSGFEVISAGDGEEGFRKVRSEHPDLILLDITMPHESGVRMYRDVVETAETANIPVIIVTGISKDFKQFIYGRKHLKPPAGYFEKPIDKAEFLSKVRSLVAAVAA
jgi:twitching motility two-component system response regulator PilH